MRCASYARYVSCVPEKNIPSDIIRQQNDRIQKYIKQNGWELVQKYADRKQDIKQKIIDYEKDIADRNRVISKQRQEIDFLTIKLKEAKSTRKEQ